MPNPEQDNTRAYFHGVSAYWQTVYTDTESYTGYALQKLHSAVVETVMARQAARGANLRVLDVGCGAGVTALELARVGCDVSGVDIAPGMIERATAQMQQLEAQSGQTLLCEFRVVSAEALPYPDASVDVLLALGLLANIRDAAPALAELRRVLKPDGLLLLTMPNLIALDVLLALPLSLPLFANATRFRRPLRMLGNIGRRLLRRPPKSADDIRFGYSVLPWRYARRLQGAGFGAVTADALTFGPIMPFGLRLLNDAQTKRISERVYNWSRRQRGLRWFGSLVLYCGTGEDKRN